ncbi:hypothetical protein LTR95_017415, partial [Oleoguttula sp. CCFEE 5521]
MSTSDSIPLVDPYKGHTSLHGQAIKHDHDNMSNMMLGDGGGFNSGVGANHLPYGYTDTSLVRIPIKISDYSVTSPPSQPEEAEKKSGFMRKLSSFGGGGGKKDEGEVRVVGMSRGDYLKYWVKGEDGKFAEGVVEPEEGRGEWLRKQFVFDDEVRRQDREMTSKQKVGKLPPFGFQPA